VSDNQVIQQIGPWRVLLEWEHGATQGGPISMEITPAADATPEELAHGLSQTVLRQVDFKAAFNQMVRQNTQVSEPLRPVIDGMGEELREMLKDGVTDKYLALLADAYLMLVHFGVHNVAGELAGLVDRTPSGVLQQLKRARKAGLLTSIPGRAGGHLTPRAEELLAVTRLD